MSLKVKGIFGGVVSKRPGEGRRRACYQGGVGILISIDVSIGGELDRNTSVENRVAKAARACPGQRPEPYCAPGHIFPLLRKPTDHKAVKLFCGKVPTLAGSIISNMPVMTNCQPLLSSLMYH
jgi:hypothetical protein